MLGFRTPLLRASKSGSPRFPVANYDKLREKPGYHFNRMAAWNESSAVCELWFLVNKPKPIYRTRSRHYHGDRDARKGRAMLADLKVNLGIG